jgi:excisionase family DNA binding protein
VTKAPAKPLTLRDVIDAPDRLFTLSEVAVILRIDPVTAERWCRAGKLAAVKVGGRWRVSGHEVQRAAGAAVVATSPPVQPTSRADLERCVAAALGQTNATKRAKR